MSEPFVIREYEHGDNNVVVLLEKEISPNGYAGFVLTSEFHEEIVLYVDDDYLSKNRVRVAMATRFGKSSEDEDPLSVIIMSSGVFEDLMEDNLLGNFTLFHEIGHFVHHNEKIMSTKIDENSKKRIEAVNNFTVYKDELEADAYAAKYLGGYEVYFALLDCQDDFAKHQVLLGNSLNTKEECYPITEYEYRAEAIEKTFNLEFTTFDEEEPEC